MRRLLGKVAIDTRPLRIPAYRRLWLSTVVTAIGSQLTAVAVPKQVYDLTGSSGWVGVSAGVALVPLLVFGLYGGAVADVVDRRKLLLVTNTGIAVTSVLLWLQAAFPVRSVWLVIVLLGLQQVFFAANSPARTASIARLVPAEQLPAATALGSTVMMFGGVFGPMLAGALMPVVGLPTLYLVDAVALTATIWSVWRLPPLPPLNAPSRRAGLKDVLDGFRYLALQRVLLASFLLDIIAMVFGMPRALFPEMAEKTFGDPPGGGLALGWLFAAIPLGALLCGLVSGWTSRVARHGVGVVLAVVAWGVAVIGFGFSHALWLAVVFLAVGGAADMISMVFRSAILQTAASDDMRGRMQGVFIVVVAGGPRLADLLHGTTGALVGPGVATAVGGALVVLATGLAVLAIPAIWRYRFTPERVAS
ncbi:MFS transporter [Saccharothrix coeruleofusca]|uniref:MFS transporter n=1 Tax=Saccharothrix coeruleofusca TaxID=33919 RepID=A0A918AHU8_9PSEU|nr:MFS transporter [Saccharothrix coeruleofusca]MBP2340571.1 MFS family permease [Saccharothrix coeruleofusca]GGP34549.1 MFS transporter [Saccharothrix coeruleofusca]